MFKRVELIAVVLVCLAVGVSGQLIGIDFGTQFTKVAMIHSGAGKAMTIVENQRSERKIETAAAFANSERFYESEAINKRLRNTKNSFIYTKMFLEQLTNEVELTRLRKDLLLDHTLINEQTDGLVNFLLEGFSLHDDNKQVHVSIEQVFGMIFRYIKQLAEKHGKTKVTDCVVALPNYWTLDQRVVILNALAIAELYPLSIINENTAAAIQYGMNRQDNKTHKVVFYNMGSNGLQVTLAEYRVSNDTKIKPPIETLHIIDEFGMSRAGGLEIDIILFNHFNKIFENKYKKQLNQRAKVKLLNECQNVKEVLSANKDANLLIEELFQGIDFQSRITRSEFDSLINDLLTRITQPIIPFLRANDIRPRQINNVELIGGSIRIPRLQYILNETFQGAQVGTHINGDQSMAFGAVYQAANSSKKYKVKGMHLYDGFNFEIRVVIKNLKETEETAENYFFKNITLFKKKNRFNLIKDVGFKCKENLAVEFWKEDSQGLQLVKTVKLLNVSDYQLNEKFADTNPKLVISVSTDPINVINVDEVKMTITKEEATTYLEQVKKPKKVKKPAKTQAQTKEAEKAVEQEHIDGPVQQKPQQAEEEEKNAEKQKLAANNSNTTNNKTKKAKKDEDESEYETVERKKMVQKSYSLKIQKQEIWHLRERLSGDKVALAQKLLIRLDKEQQGKRKLAQAKNKLEAAIYEGRQLLENNNDFKTFSTKAERDNIQQQINSKEDKVYESNSVEGYLEHYKDMYQYIQKIKNRIVENRQRDQIKKKAFEALTDYTEKYKKLEKENDWVSSEQKQPLINLIQSTKKSLQGLYEQQSSKPKHQDPVVLNKNVLKKIDTVKDLYYSLKNIPKPKPKKKDSQKSKDNDTKTTKDEEASKTQEKAGQDEL